MLNPLARCCDAVAFGFSHGSMAVWYEVTKRLFDFVSPMRRERGCDCFTRCISLLADGSDCPMCCTLAISSVLSKVCVV